MNLTEEQRLSIIKHAAENSQKISPMKSVEEFVAEIKTQELFGEHGLLENQSNDIDDEMSLIDNNPSAEAIEEEDLSIGISDEMKGMYE